MNSKLIVMLTHNDVTVPNAYQIFDTCKDLPVECWGFKDVGLPQNEMENLYCYMKQNNKKTFLEVVTYSEEECLKGAKLAVDLSVDYLLGTICSEKIIDYLSRHNISYLPFCGRVSGSPSILEGEIPEIIEEAKKLLAHGLFGIDLLAFRHKDGAELARKYLADIHEPVVIAGSIASKQRMEFISEINPWGYTMGSALFTKNFVKSGDFRQNLEAVLSYSNTLN